MVIGVELEVERRLVVVAVNVDDASGRVEGDVVVVGHARHIELHVVLRVGLADAVVTCVMLELSGRRGCSDEQGKKAQNKL